MKSLPLLFLLIAANGYAYNIDAVAQAVGKTLEQQAQKDFLLIDVPAAGGNAKNALKLLRAARDQKTAIAVGSSKLTAIRDLLESAINRSGKERFDGVIVVIVGPTKEPELFETLLSAKGFRPLYATYDETALPPPKPASSQIAADKPKLVIGTYQKGNNITEPRPKKSEYLKTLHGGILVAGDAVGYYLFVQVIKKPTKELYIVIEYENPAGGQPFVNDMVFKRDAEEFHFSAPTSVKGLKTYSNYEIIVKIFESREAKEPIDTLKQTIRSYVDTRGDKALFYDRIKEKS